MSSLSVSTSTSQWLEVGLRVNLDHVDLLHPVDDVHEDFADEGGDAVSHQILADPFKYFAGLRKYLVSMSRRRAGAKSRSWAGEHHPDVGGVHREPAVRAGVWQGENREEAGGSAYPVWYVGSWLVSRCPRPKPAPVQPRLQMQWRSNSSQSSWWKCYLVEWWWNQCYLWVILQLLVMTIMLRMMIISITQCVVVLDTVGPVSPLEV